MSLQIKNPEVFRTHRGTDRYDAFIERVGKEVVSSANDILMLCDEVDSMEKRAESAERRNKLFSVACAVAAKGRIKASSIASYVKQWDESGLSPEHYSRMFHAGSVTGPFGEDGASTKQSSAQGVDGGRASVQSRPHEQGRRREEALSAALDEALANV